MKHYEQLQRDEQPSRAGGGTKLLSIDSCLSYSLYSSVGRNYSSPKYKYPTRTSLRQISVKTSLRITLMLSPKENVVSSYQMCHKNRHLVFWHHLCSAYVPCPFQIVFALSFLRGVYLAQQESQCKYRKSKGLMFTESKYSGGISFNGQIFKLVLTLFDHFCEHDILKSHLLVMRRQEKKVNSASYVTISICG